MKLGERAVLKSLNVSIKHRITCIMGPNGAGKTTILKTIAGVVEAEEGEVAVCGKRPSSARRELSYVPSSLQAEPFLRVEDVVRIYSYGAGSPLDCSRALEIVGLPAAMARRFFSELSSGEQRLVLIASALARKPSLLLLDEPFSHLDLANQVRVAELLLSLAERGGTTIVYTAHEPHHCALAENVVLVKNGRVVAEGEPRETLKASLLREVYGIEFAGEEGLAVPAFFQKALRSTR